LFMTEMTLELMMFLSLDSMESLSLDILSLDWDLSLLFTLDYFLFMSLMNWSLLDVLMGILLFDWICLW
jgi:hypothetical protein